MSAEWLAHALALDPELGAEELFASRRARLGLAPLPRAERNANWRALFAVRQRLWSAEPSEIQSELGRLKLEREPDLAEYAARLRRLIELRPEFEAANADAELPRDVLAALRDLASAPPQEKLARSEHALRALEDPTQRLVLQRGVQRLHRHHRALYDLEKLCFARILAFDALRVEPITAQTASRWNWRRFAWWFFFVGAIRGLAKLVLPGSRSH